MQHGHGEGHDNDNLHGGGGLQQDNKYGYPDEAEAETGGSLECGCAERRQ
ncbi:hypothetical protein GCM10023116_33660 [Kistimonas scapharcae]|uniref:Uncharacterized protein n=1 Tax=Kistimonas scapharcae TaxID=1036133 RepID=A0ABP8V6J2_9GAMM